MTGLLARDTNETAVKKALIALILTSLGERLYQPDVGSKVRTLLFEPIDSITENLLRSTITATIKNNEPRVTLRELNIVGDPDNDRYLITIVASLINIPTNEFMFSVPLKRVR